MDLAWIGTGIMGAPMARRLLRAGHSVNVFNRTAAKAQSLAGAGAKAMPDAAQAARHREVIFIMVSDTPDVESVIDQIEPALGSGSIVVDMSTISPSATRVLARRMAARGISFLDAPVSGGETGAINGTLAIMVGGDGDAFERVRPLLEHLGRWITHMGESGAGQMTKLANQIAVSLTLQATIEALAFARRGGLDPALVLQAISEGAAGSWQLINLGPKIISHDYKPGFFLSLMRKDLRLVAEAARNNKIPIPATAVVSALFDAAAAMGHERDGTQALASVLEKLTQA